MSEINKIEEMIGLEEENARDLESSVKNLKNRIVREILMSVAYDSIKHAGFYRAISTIRKEAQRSLSEEEYVKLENVLRKHVEIESKMLKEVEKLLNDEKDLRVRHILLEILEDEKKHHALMQKLLESVVRRETLFEKDIWDMIWGGVPGHGTPLG